MVRRIAWVGAFAVACAGTSGSQDRRAVDPAPATGATADDTESAAATQSAELDSAPQATAAPTGESRCGHRGEPEPAAMAGITAAHNAIRCELRRPDGGAVPSLSWSRALAAEAQRYADAIAKNDCNLQHSTTELGENLFAGSGKYTAREVVAKWAAEKRCFRYQVCPGCCTCTCGHYSQVVWGQTERLGCGMASCSDGSEVWVCNYDPSGNIMGEMPW